MLKLNYFSSNKSIVALIATSFLSLTLFACRESQFIKSILVFWNDKKTVIMKPRNDLNTFIGDRNVFKDYAIENIQYKLSIDYLDSPKNKAIQKIKNNLSDFIRIKENQLNLDSNEWVFANVFSYPKTQISNTMLIGVGKNDFIEYDNRRFIVIDIDGNLMGRIIDLGNISSIVQLVNNPHNQVIVQNYDSSLQSVLMVPISYNKAKLNGVTNQDALSVGDTLYTSSNSAVYLPRIPVCKVIEIRDGENKNPFKKVIVELLSNLNRPNFAIVIASDKVLDPRFNYD